MTRKYRPTVITVGHEGTELAEAQRERERPVAAVPASRPEPEPDAPKVPPHGKPPKNLTVRAAIPDDMMLLRTDEVDLLLGMADESFKRENPQRSSRDPLTRVRRDPKLAARRQTF